MSNHLQIFLILIIFNLSTITIVQCQTKADLSQPEKQNIEIFNGFKKYLVESINKDLDVTDTANIKHVLLNFVLSENNLDSLDKIHFKPNEIPDEKMKQFSSELGGLFQYFFERKKENIAEHLNVRPLRLSNQAYISSQLSQFQRDNTLVMFDDRYPTKPISFLLFVPVVPGKISAPRIWSWTLQFEFGMWAFKSPMGTVGMEYLFSHGVEGPSPERRIGY